MCHRVVVRACVVFQKRRQVCRRVCSLPTHTCPPMCLNEHVVRPCRSRCYRQHARVLPAAGGSGFGCCREVMIHLKRKNRHPPTTHTHMHTHSHTHKHTYPPPLHGTAAPVKEYTVHMLSILVNVCKCVPTITTQH